MKIKFNYYERVAGIFVLVAVGAAVAMMFVTAVEQKWFASKVKFYTVNDSADGLHNGTPVHLSGLVVGEVTDVELIEMNEVRMTLSIQEKYAKQLRIDSYAQIGRPFILAEKVVELKLGDKSSSALEIGALIPMKEGYDIMDLVSGKTLGPFLSRMESLMGNLSTLAEAFADPKRTQAFIRIFDRVDPLIGNLNKMTVEVAELTHEMNYIVPQIRKTSPEAGAHMAELLERLNTLTGVVTPAFKEVGPDLPRVSRRAVEALDEMVVTLKAMQRSFFLSGKSKDVREEEKLEQLKRMPTNQPAK